MTPKPRRLPVIPKRQSKVGFVTIAAGFRFDRGVLVCADTQFSGSLKHFDTKLNHHIASRLAGEDVMHTVLAMSGTHGYMQMVVADCQMALAGLATRPVEDGEIHQDSVRTVLTDVMVNFHEKHVFKHPLYGYAGGPSVSLIAAIWMQDWNATLYWTSETAVNEVIGDPFVFAGSGSEVANYVTKPLIEPHSDKPLTLEQAVLVGAHALRTAKDTDPNCGGSSEFAALFDDGSCSHIHRFDIARAESHSRTFEAILRDLFYVSSNIDNPERESALRIANSRLKQIKREQKKDWEKIIKLTNQLEESGSQKK